MLNYKEVLAYTKNNRKPLMNDHQCGCFFCGHIFAPAEITLWIDEDAQTGACPYCCADTIIGSYAGYPLNEAFLEEIHHLWSQEEE